jgi:hypothetical protein
MGDTYVFAVSQRKIIGIISINAAPATLSPGEGRNQSATVRLNSLFY